MESNLRLQLSIMLSIMRTLPKKYSSSGECGEKKKEN